MKIEKPKYIITWYVAGLGLSPFVVLFLALNDILPDLSWGQLNVIPTLVIPLVLAALITGVIALKKGERSFVVLVGLIPAILFTLLFIAELLFME